MRQFRNLRHLIDDADMTQADLAKAAGISTSALNERLTGKHPFNAWQMKRIADVLNIEPERYIYYFFPQPGGNSGKVVQ